MQAITDIQPLADLTNATADYESAYRAFHGANSNAVVDRAAASQALGQAAERVEGAFARLAAALGPDLAKQLRVALIFAAGRTSGERKQYDNTTATERALRRPWEYA